MNDNLKTYEGNEILNIGKPFVIITGDLSGVPNISEQYRSDLFVIDENCKQNSILRSFCVSIRDKDINLSYIMNFALQDAKQQLNKWLSTEYEKTKNLVCQIQSFTLTEVEPISLYRLFLKKECIKDLKKIYDLTINEKLKILFEQMKVAPRIEIDNLK